MMRDACQSALFCVAPEHLRELILDNHAIRELATPNVVWLRSTSGGRAGLGIALSIDYSVTEDPRRAMRVRWQPSTLAYSFRLVDRLERELLTYHWMPGPLFLGPDHPHLHVSAALEVQADALTRSTIPLDKLHLPTGQVSIAAFVRMLITELGIEPRRDDWRATLDRVESAIST